MKINLEVFSPVHRIVDQLLGRNFEVYYVGGAVRDVIRGKVPADIDLATNARPDDIMALFEKGDHKVRDIGKSFPVILIDDIEVATYRTDKYGGYSDKNVKTNFSDSIEEDLQRRDLTINSIAVNAEDGVVFDPYKGIGDIHSGKIRFTGDPSQRIIEDPNRILRACRFVAAIGGILDNKTRDAMLLHSDIVKDHIAPERIYKEILKAMDIQIASPFFITMHDVNILKHIFPSLDRCWDHNHGGYHTEDIFTHSMQVGDGIHSKFPLLKLAGYLHDVGKPVVARDRGKGFLQFIKHERIGSELIIEELKSLKFSIEDINFISQLTAAHMQNVYDTTVKSRRKLLAKIENRFASIKFSDLLRINIADRKGNDAKKPWSLHTVKSIIKKFNDSYKEENVAFSIKDLAVNGADVMQELNILPGPTIGKVLKACFELVLEDPSKNKKGPLLEYIRTNKAKLKLSGDIK